MKKQTVLKAVKEFPQDVDLNELFEKLLVREKIEKGLQQAEKGETVAHEKVVKYFKKKWGK